VVRLARERKVDLFRMADDAGAPIMKIASVRRKGNPGGAQAVQVQKSLI